MSTLKDAPVQPPLLPPPEPAPKSKKAANVRLMWAGGVGVVLIGVLAIWSTSGSSGSGPVKAAAADPVPVAAAATETKPAPAQSPSDVPGAASWIPVYPASKPEVTSSAQTPDGDQQVSTFKTGDPPQRVISYFQDQLKSSGFEIKSASSGEDNGSLRAEDGSRKRSLILNVSVSFSGTGTDARMVTSEKK